MIGILVACAILGMIVLSAVLLKGEYTIDVDKFDSDIEWGESVSLEGIEIIDNRTLGFLSMPLTRDKVVSIDDTDEAGRKKIVFIHNNREFTVYFDVKYKVEFFILKDEAMLMIDTSGIALHKRGYRPDAGVAPLRETLAAAIALTSRPSEDILFWDPFCGSGTIAIEAAMIARKIAPGLKRSFASEDFPRISADMWRAAREEAVSFEIKDSKFEAWASDIDEDILDVAYENALRAGVEENINLFHCDARKIEKPADRRGTIVCNPPYGERMGDMKEIEWLYKDIGRHFKTFEPWHIYVITSCDYFERLYGRSADKTRKLYNGMLPCTLYQFFKPAEFRNDKPKNRSFDKKHFDKKSNYGKNNGNYKKKG